jgi:hypothetical protein
MKAIARPNNDTLYVTSILDLRNEPVVVHYPAFDSKFVALETSAYDHYCDVPLSTTKGDFKKPVNVLYYTDRTKGYKGEPVKGVDKIIKMSGDFPHRVPAGDAPRGRTGTHEEKPCGHAERSRCKRFPSFSESRKNRWKRSIFPAYSSDFGIYENNFLGSDAVRVQSHHL